MPDALPINSSDLPDPGAHWTVAGAAAEPSPLHSPDASSQLPSLPATVLPVLRALARMARVSRRHEADVQSALRGAGVALSAEQRDAALRELLEAGCIERIVPLSDGGILVSVTATGLTRATQSSATQSGATHSGATHSGATHSGE